MSQQYKVGDRVTFKAPSGIVTQTIIRRADRNGVERYETDSGAFFWPDDEGRPKPTQSFSNGRSRAEAYLNQKMKEIGVRVENINNQFTIRETSRGFDVLYKGLVVYQSYNREEAESWARSNKSTPMDYDESSTPK